MFSKPTTPSAAKARLLRTAPLWRSDNPTLARTLLDALEQNGCPPNAHNIFTFGTHPLLGGTHNLLDSPAALSAGAARLLSPGARPAISEEFEREATEPTGAPSKPRAPPVPRVKSPFTGTRTSFGSHLANGTAPPDSPTHSQKDVAARIALQALSDAALRHISSFTHEYPLATKACLKLSSQSGPSDAPTRIDPSGFDTLTLIAAENHIRHLQIGVETIVLSVTESAAAGGQPGAELSALLSNPATRDHAIAKYILSHSSNYRVGNLELACGCLPLVDALIGLLTERHSHACK